MPWTLSGEGIVIAVRVTPRGGRDVLAAGTGDYFSARLAAAPIDGAANAALVALVARHFDVPRRDVALVGGATARLKRLKLSGDPQRLAEAARALYGEAP